MTPIEVFAPGKLFVIGEYAVLSGARALVVALDLGIVTRVEPARAWSVSATDLGVEGSLDEVRTDSRVALLAFAAETARCELGAAEPLRIVVRGAQALTRRKHGLGGSAASVVSILGAVAAAKGEDLAHRVTRDRLFAIALRVHREHQHGRGSGADVAASVYGGWLDYALGEGGPAIARAAIPPDACLAAAWSGVASDTARAIDAFESAATLGRMRGTLERFWSAVETQDRVALCAELDAYGSILEEIGGAGVGRQRIAELVRAARTQRFAAKGSGAVGGDCAIALGFAPADRTGLERAWRAIGAEPLPLSVDATGVRVVDHSLPEAHHA